MTPRPYRLGKRAETAEATRRRIVEATVHLHAEQGITATSVKDIAARADVGIGTVYHHFPAYGDLVRACGALTNELTRPPTPAIFAGLEGEPADRRLAHLVGELFAYYERFPKLEEARCERTQQPSVDAFFTEREQEHVALVREALLAAGDDDRLVRTVVALTDVAVYRSLVTGGYSPRAAADRVSGVLLAWLAPRLGGADRHQHAQPAGETVA